MTSRGVWWAIGSWKGRSTTEADHSNDLNSAATGPALTGTDTSPSPTTTSTHRKLESPSELKPGLLNKSATSAKDC